RPAPGRPPLGPDAAASSLWVRSGGRSASPMHHVPRRAKPVAAAILRGPRACSSAGERPLHTREVPGSIPGTPIARHASTAAAPSPGQAYSPPRERALVVVVAAPELGAGGGLARGSPGRAVRDGRRGRANRPV